MNPSPSISVSVISVRNCCDGLAPLRLPCNATKPTRTNCWSRCRMTSRPPMSQLPFMPVERGFTRSCLAVAHLNNSFYAQSTIRPNVHDRGASHGTLINHAFYLAGSNTPQTLPCNDHSQRLAAGPVYIVA